jgi:Domain of unknown function (DUF4287)/Domain of unknown function (DUF5655)
MSLKAYLDNIEAKTGKTPQQFVDLARSEGLLEPGIKPGQIVSWLKAEHGLGHGHAMAIVATIKQTTQPPTSDNQKIAKHFSGKKATWRPTYDKIASKVSSFGSDTDVQAGTSYISLRRNGKKFAIVQVTQRSHGRRGQAQGHTRPRQTRERRLLERDGHASRAHPQPEGRQPGVLHLAEERL